jgi:hypothetical protein
MIEASAQETLPCPLLTSSPLPSTASGSTVATRAPWIRSTTNPALLSYLRTQSRKPRCSPAYENRPICWTRHGVRSSRTRSGKLLGIDVGYCLPCAHHARAYRRGRGDEAGKGHVRFQGICQSPAQRAARRARRLQTAGRSTAAHGTCGPSKVLGRRLRTPSLVRESGWRCSMGGQGPSLTLQARIRLAGRRRA